MSVLFLKIHNALTEPYCIRATESGGDIPIKSICITQSDSSLGLNYITG